jgi:hypothetical protein
MWKIPNQGPALELFKFGLNLLLLIVTWTLGQLLILRWEEKKRVREISRDMRRQFHELYGQFKSSVRLWRAQGKPTDPRDCPELLERAVLAEGLVESLLSDLAALKKLTDDECTALGLFRQGYQTMRQALTNKRPSSVPADYDSDPYHLFNDLTTTVSRLVVAITYEPSPEEARKSFDGIIDVRTDEWDKAVELMKEKRPWDQLIAEITKLRKEDAKAHNPGLNRTDTALTRGPAG